jgi:cephalosporin hydroxylase
MRLTLCTEEQTLTAEEDGATTSHPLYSREAFELLSKQWVKVGWDQKYPYTFSWMGRPVIQLPEDMIRIQEVIYRTEPDIIVETGVAHGGSLIFYASLCKALGKGRVIGVDIEIRPHNREAIEAHPLAPYITLVEGDSTAPATVERVRDQIAPEEKVLVLLDSCHTKAHVLSELDVYSDLVTPGSYIVATDGIMQDLHDTPRGKAGWRTDHPAAAAAEFAVSNPEFVLEQPPWVFNESSLEKNITHWPSAWLRRRDG